MAYCTATETTSEFPIFPQTSTVQRYTETMALISSKIPRAESEINTYCARRYSVPFASIPPRINQLAVNLTAYYALQAKFTKDSHNTNDWVDSLYKDSIKALEDIRDRKIDLVDTTGSLLTERTANSRIVSSTQNYQPFADVDDIIDWRIPSDRINAIDRSN